MLGLGSDDDAVDPLVRKAAAWSWRLLVIFGAILALVWLIARLEVIVVPVALAVILCALLLPAVDWLDGRGAPRGGAVALVLVTMLMVVMEQLFFGPQIANMASTLVLEATEIQLTG
jgi:predicted PurR-regulated permease PerM